jgi:hypothetical protein
VCKTENFRLGRKLQNTKKVQSLEAPVIASLSADSDNIYNQLLAIKQKMITSSVHRAIKVLKSPLISPETSALIGRVKLFYTLLHIYTILGSVLYFKSVLCNSLEIIPHPHVPYPQTYLRSPGSSPSYPALVPRGTNYQTTSNLPRNWSYLNPLL